MTMDGVNFRDLQPLNEHLTEVTKMSIADCHLWSRSSISLKNYTNLTTLSIWIDFNKPTFLNFKHLENLKQLNIDWSYFSKREYDKKFGLQSMYDSIKLSKNGLEILDLSTLPFSLYAQDLVHGHKDIKNCKISL